MAGETFSGATWAPGEGVGTGDGAGAGLGAGAGAGVGVGAGEIGMTPVCPADGSELPALPVAVLAAVAGVLDPLFEQLLKQMAKAKTTNAGTANLRNDDN